MYRTTPWGHMSTYHRDIMAMDETPLDMRLITGISHAKHNMDFRDEIRRIKNARSALDDELPEHQRRIFKMRTHRELYHAEDARFNDVLTTYVAYINGRYGERVDENEVFAEMLKQDAVTLKLKDKFNLVRPHQMAKMLGIDFDYEPNVSATTPSFPSGHATQGLYFMMLMLERAPKAFENPEEYDGLARYAVDVGLRRVYAGLHYPSDNVGAYELVGLRFPSDARAVVDAAVARIKYVL